MGKGFRGLAAALLLTGAAALLTGAVARSQSGEVVLDRVVAVVNNSAILASDVAREMHLSVLEPSDENNAPTAGAALDRLISRTLIQQQIRQGDALVVPPTQAEIDARTTELRRNLPACARADCASDAGWTAFLTNSRLTPVDVQNYMRARLEMLAFVEDRFRAGIQVPQEEIDRYYRESLVPQYANGAAVPAESAVAPRIEEILLQRQVNALFDAWLENLRKQGDVEIVDPTYVTPSNSAAANAGGKAQ